MFVIRAYKIKMLRIRNSILPVAISLLVLSEHVHPQHDTRIDSLKNLINKTNEKSSLADDYLELSVLTYSSDAKESAAWAEKVIDMSGKTVSDKNLGDAHAYVGRALVKQDKHDSALVMYNRALTFYEALNNTFLQARIHNALGYLYLKQSAYASALEAFYEALNLIEQLGPENEHSLASLLNNIGNIHYFQENYDQALENYMDAYEFKKTHGDSSSLANTINNIGIIHEARNEFVQAISYYERALAIYEKVGNIEMQCNTLHNMGIIALQQNNLEEAESLYQQCLAIGHRHNNDYGKLNGYAGLTSLEAQLLHQEKAIAYADSAITLIDKTERYERKKEVYESIFDMYKKLGNYERALDYHLLITEVNDSLFNLKRTRQLEELHTRYSTEKKEQEIKLLQQEKLQAQTRNRLWITVFILTFLLAVFVIYIFFIRHRKSLVLLEKEKELDRFKSRFFANISHEFRTPLTLIQGPLHELKQQETNDKKQRIYHLMQKNVDTLLRMVNQILDLAKIEAGKRELKLETAEVVKLIRQWVMSFHSLAETKNIQLTFSSACSRIETKLDVQAMETMVNNMLSNALKYEIKGGCVEIFVDVVRLSESQQRALAVNVKNYNSFIPSSDLEKIFHRYYLSQESSQNQQSVQGTGIGLALVKELATLHGGFVNAISSKSEGTAFTIQIPLSENPVIEKSVTTKDPSDTSVTEKRTQKEKMSDWISEHSGMKSEIILVIEDNQDVREFISDSLKENQYQVIQAENGQQGIDLALKIVPDLVISDVMMPQKDGYTVCHELKNDEKTSHVPIILLTAKASFKSKMKGLETQADNYLIKPFNTSELLTRIHNLITLRKKLREKFSGIVAGHESSPAKSLDDLFLQKVRDSVQKNISNEAYRVEDLGKSIGMSRSQVHRKLTALTGIPPNQFIRNYRLEKAMEQLRRNSSTVAEIAYDVGFSSPAYFGKCFREYFKLSPGEVRNAGQ